MAYWAPERTISAGKGGANGMTDRESRLSWHFDATSALKGLDRGAKMTG